MNTRILLVEDHLPLRLSLSASLRQTGWAVTAVASAEEARQVLDAETHDVVVLDWNLPGQSGLDLLTAWRAEGRSTPVILLTARDTLNDRVRGLDSGAQDYLVKPFATAELIARIRVQLRDRRQHVLVLSACRVDLSRQLVLQDGEELPLTTRESELLSYLAARPGQAVERDTLLRAVWGYAPGAVTRTIDNTVLRLRAKIEADPARPRHVITVHGVGYRFVGGST